MMAGPRPSDTLTDTRLEGMAYLYDHASRYQPAKAGRSYGNAFSQFSGGYLYSWFKGGVHLYALTDKGEAVVEWLRAVRRAEGARSVDPGGEGRPTIHPPLLDGAGTSHHRLDGSKQTC